MFSRNALSIIAAICTQTIDGSAQAHMQWSDGTPVPEQIRQRCCSDTEAHLLPPGSVHPLADGWHIDGYSRVVPYGSEMPSPDGKDWGFWTDYRYGHAQAIGAQSKMRCLFLNVMGF
jgi:hypothetical protein